MEVTRLRDTPIVTFINKLDRDIKDPIELLDEVEDVLKIKCAPIVKTLAIAQKQAQMLTASSEISRRPRRSTDGASALGFSPMALT